jgi:hypothetical protein
MEQRIYPGTWCDIAQQGDTTLHVTALDGAVHYRSVAFLDSPPIVHPTPGRWLLFLRAAGTRTGQVLVAGKDQHTGDAFYAIGGGTPVSLGPCHGIHCVSIEGREDDWLLHITRLGKYDTYQINRFGTHELIREHVVNTSQGFLDRSDLADMHRDSIPGMVYPFTAGFYSVGQNADAGPDRLRAFGPNGDLCGVYQGFAQRPNARFNNGVLYVAAYVQGGALLQAWPTSELPWGNDAPPPPDPDRPFVAKPGAVIEDILPIIRDKVATAVRGNVGYLRKALHHSGWGEWWDWDETYIGHLEDASTGKVLPDGSLDGYYFTGMRVWMPRRVYTGWGFNYTGTIQWRNGTKESFPVKMSAEVGSGRYSGRDVTWVVTYDPRRTNSDGSKPGWLEKFYFGPTGWVKWESYKEDASGNLVIDSAPTPGPPGAQDQNAWVEPLRPKPYQPIIGAAPEPPTPQPPPAPDATQVVAYLEYKNLQDRLEDTYKNHGGHPPLTVVTHVNPEGEVWRQHYFDRRNPGGMSHEEAMRSIESQIDVIEGRPDRWATPPTPQPPMGEIPHLGGIRVAGKFWESEHGPEAPLGAGALYALDGRNYRPYLDSLLGRAQYVRVFAGYLSPRSGRNELFPADARNRLPTFMGEARSRGLKVEVCALTDTALFNYDWHSHVDVIARMRPDMLELANEVQHETQDRALEGALGALYQRARSAGYQGPIAFGSNEVPGANGARKDELDPANGLYRTAGGTYNTVHLNRGENPWYREACRTREQEAIQDVHEAAVCNDEPNRVEDMEDPRGFAFLLGILGKGWNLATTFHAGQARDCQPYTGVVAEAFHDYVLGWSLLPRARYTFKNARWSDSPVATASFMDPIEGDPPGENIWRAYSFLLDDHTGYTVVCGSDVERGVIHWQNGWHPAEPGAAIYRNGRTLIVIRITR